MNFGCLERCFLGISASRTPPAPPEQCGKVASGPKPSSIAQLKQLHARKWAWISARCRALRGDEAPACSGGRRAPGQTPRAPLRTLRMRTACHVANKPPAAPARLLPRLAACFEATRRSFCLPFPSNDSPAALPGDSPVVSTCCPCVQAAMPAGMPCMPCLLTHASQRVRSLRSHAPSRRGCARAGAAAASDSDPDFVAGEAAMDSDGSEFLMESEDEDGPRGGRRARYSIPMGARRMPPWAPLPASRTRRRAGAGGRGAFSAAVVTGSGGRVLCARANVASLEVGRHPRCSAGAVGRSLGGHSELWGFVWDTAAGFRG